MNTRGWLVSVAALVIASTPTAAQGRPIPQRELDSLTGRLDAELRAYGAAQNAFFAAHRRFARPVDTLDFRYDAAISISAAGAGSIGFEAHATFRAPRNLRCVMWIGVGSPSDSLRPRCRADQASLAIGEALPQSPTIPPAPVEPRSGLSVSSLTERPLLALLPAAAYAILYGFTKRRLAAYTGAAWALYALYEYAISRGIGCDSDCNIRVDLLLIYPTLIVLSIAALFVRR